VTWEAPVYNIAIALASGILVFLLFFFGIAWSAMASLMPAMIVITVAYVFLVKRTIKQVKVIMDQVQRAAQAQKIDRALNLLKSAIPLGKWQILLEGQIKGQVGQLLYMKTEVDEALPYLAAAGLKDHMSQSMYAACLYQKGRKDEMEQVLDRITLANKKEPFVWALAGYLFAKIGKKDKAIAVLADGAEKIPEDENLKVNLLALQNGKRMKMKRFGEMWYSFHLEPRPARQTRPRFSPRGR